MKRLFHRNSPLFLAIIAFITSFPILAKEDPCCPFVWEPYVGFQAEFRHARWPKEVDGAGKLFAKHYPQANVFGGLKIVDFLGVEVGYKDTGTKSKQLVTINESERVLDAPLLFPPNEFSSKTHFRGWHAELVGFLPLCINDFPFELLGAVGATRIHTFHRVTEISDSVDFFDIRTSSRNFKKKRSVLTLGLGAQYLVGECYGFRIKAEWENTKHIHRQFPLEPTRVVSVRLKDTYNYGFGVFFFF